MSGLDAPVFDRLWSAARRARERRGSAGDGEVRVPRLTPEEALAYDGLPWPGRGRPVLAGQDLRRRLTLLEAAVRDAGDDLMAVLERHGGPVRDLPAERRAARAARSSLFADLAEQVAAMDRPGLPAWLEHAQRHGLVRYGDEPRVRAALAVVGALPADPPVDRSVLAAHTCAGDSHALDHGTALERQVRTLLLWLEGGQDEAALGTLDVRRLYARFGVQLDPSSSTALTLGLPSSVGSATGRLLAAAPGHATVLPYGILLAAPPRWPPDLTVFVCENPAVVHAAVRALGARSRPVVCTAGWPGAAVQLLLGGLRDAGAELRHHADFDADGLAMHQLLQREFGARPWRFTASDYREAVATATVALPPTPGPIAPQEPLATALSEVRLQVVEELTLDRLLSDLVT